jgi:exo-1,4-beta-D-glucosaminidase
VRAQGDKASVDVTMRNTSKSLAFMVHLRLTKGKSGDDITPILWDDNYVSIFPGEERTLTGNYDVSALDGKEPKLEVDGWNVTASGN